MSDFHTHKELGYDLMLMLAESIEHSSLKNINKDGCYQELILKNDFYIEFTKWRNGEVPFYLILFNVVGNYIFELDLSMVIEKEESYYWNLKVPSNETTKNEIIKLHGNKVELDATYVSNVKEQKKILKSGVKTPRTGYSFVEGEPWEALCVKLCELLKSIIEAHTTTELQFNIQYQAENDDINSLQRISARVRRGQRLFRKNLIELYEGKCTVSGWTPTEVLEAVHIISHSESGINHTDNGILLRGDLHRLFDLNLIKIEPNSYILHVSDELKNSNYWKLNGNKIRKRIDGGYPSSHYLKVRWETAKKET